MSLTHAATHLATRRTALTAAAGLTALAAGTWWFTDQAPYPYAQRRLLDLQLPFLAKADLDQILQPRTGERMLELGPGTGLQTLHIAPQLGPEGRLDIVDIQQEMLDHVMSGLPRRRWTSSTRTAPTHASCRSKTGPSTRSTW